MMTLEQKNEKAYIRADYCDNPVLVYELMHLLESEPDWRMKSLVGYHLMRKFLDDDTFTPEQELEMENVQRPLSAEYWNLPVCAMFPASQVDAYSTAGYYIGCSNGYLINLCSFVEESPIIGYTYACKTVLSETQIIKGCVRYYDENLSQRYPEWEFYKIDKSLTDDMTALFATEFADVHRVEIAPLSPEDNCLHRIFTSN